MPTAEIITMTNRMSPADYERERAQLRETYGDSSKEAAAKRDQALAILFYRSGWTQEELAKKEGKSQKWVDFRIRFGRFLNFSTDVLKPNSAPNNLTEGKFRSYWAQTDISETNERKRFVAIQQKMCADLILQHERRPKIGPDIVEKFADGKWHALTTIAKAIDADENHVAATLTTMQSLRGTYGARCEKRRSGLIDQYRMFRTVRKISSDEIKTKLLPILKGLKVEGAKRAATMSVQTVAALAVCLERQIEEWVEGRDQSDRRPDEFAATIAGVKDNDDE